MKKKQHKFLQVSAEQNMILRLNGVKNSGLYRWGDKMEQFYFGRKNNLEGSHIS